MPIVVEVHLLAGRYHAHVWGEAQFAMAGPEWPPSSWRLLRALASAWFGTRPAPSTAVERDALLEGLGRCSAPEMWLPATAFREIRFYQPLRYPTLEGDRALHHDFFAVPAGGRFYFAFDAGLSGDQCRLLDALLGRLRYFGRAESRAVLRLRDDLTAPPRGLFRVLPRDRAAGMVGWAPRPVLCPTADRDFRASDLWAPREEASGQKAKRLRADAPGFPVHLVDALLSARKPLPDGARWVEYAQPAGSVVHEISHRQDTPIADARHVEAHAVVLRLCRRIPIPLGEAVAVARAYRDAVVRCYRAATGGAHSMTLTGREEDGSVARGHRHLYYLPQPEAGRSEIGALVVKVPSGTSLRQEELDALMTVEWILLHPDDRYPITVVPEQANHEQVVAAHQWRSVMPFLPPGRERQGRAETLPELQLASCLEQSCGLVPIRTSQARGPGSTGTRTPVRAHEYGAIAGATRASSTWKLTQRVAHWFTVEFDSPVVLGAPVGSDAHFGLGQFAPVHPEP
ncbi:MAG: type I-U CRISPR-associated protein Cas5/Cas6 [Candidatus Rokubacteria bacterium]|nr:type I-U CRISPR-associated protein Cas5/Cas6 [Candidatus Rokubacteria bacterium]